MKRAIPIKIGTREKYYFGEFHTVDYFIQCTKVDTKIAD